jgi:hypothetical protein
VGGVALLRTDLSPCAFFGEHYGNPAITRIVRTTLFWMYDGQLSRNSTDNSSEKMCLTFLMSPLANACSAVTAVRATGSGLWPQVEDQGAAYQTEAEAGRDERNQHRGRETRKHNE